MGQEWQYDVQQGQVAGPGLGAQQPQAVLQAVEGVAAQGKALGALVTAAEHEAWV